MHWLGLFLLTATTGAAAAAELETGVAITEPAVVKRLEGSGFSVGQLLFPNAPPTKNNNLFTGPLKSVASTLVPDIRDLPPKSLDADARATFPNANASADLRMSPGLVNDARSGFVLTGVTNRMDRAYRSLSAAKKAVNCGEVRFLYRFTYDIEVADPDHPDDPTKKREVASRLPFTLAVVFNAKDDKDAMTCADIAKRWQGLDGKATTDDIVNYLLADAGPLKYLKPSQIDRIETNLQMFRLPASAKPDFGGDAEYLLRVFRRDAPGKPFVVTKLENQIDRDALLSKPAQLKAFKKWLLRPAALDELDRGVVEFPFEFLASKAISVSPGGAARSQNQPSFGLFTDAEINAAIGNFEAQTGKKLQTIRSPAGFTRRIDDLTCNGCHQTRAIAGFHFPGADPATEAPSNAVHVPGSAHFMADLPRRRAIIDAFAAKQQPDFSRPFNARPREQGLAGTRLFNGWGSICHKGTDPSFAAWTCAAGLECRQLHSSTHEPGMGVCVSAGSVRIGDPMEFGEVVYHAYGNDSYRRTVPDAPATPNNYVVPAPPADRTDYVVAHQGFRKADSTGGFPAGMLRIALCENLPGEAKCGRVAATGFNQCIADGRPFPECLQKTQTAGLRACDKANPCRADYICTAPYDLPGPNQGMGTCIPPYFMFQFRVDGHPSAPVETEMVTGEPQAPPQ